MNTPKKSLIFFKKNSQKIFLFTLISFALFLIPSQNRYFQTVPSTQGFEAKKEVSLPPPPPFPMETDGDKPADITAGGVYIEDLPSGVALYAKNEKVRFPPASTTKIMTAIVAMEYFDLDDILTVGKIVNGGRTMGLIPGEKISFEALLYGALVHSANDAAYAIAENYPGGVDRFVEEMNKKAGDLKLEDTRFVNPIGFDDDSQYTTAVDLARQAVYGLSDKTFSKIVATKSITVSDDSYTHFHTLNNVNELLGKIPGIAGVKTGFTGNAGEVLVTEIKKDDRNLILVVLKSADRFGDTKKLVDYVFSSFDWVPLEKLTPPK